MNRNLIRNKNRGGGGKARCYTEKDQEFNYRICLDGGKREYGNAAIGLALYAASARNDGAYEYRFLVRKGELLFNVRSAFVAEALALEWGLKELSGRIKG